MPKNLKRFLRIAAGGILAAILYGFGQYFITGHTDTAHLIRSIIVWIIGGAIGFVIAIKMLDL